MIQLCGWLGAICGLTAYWLVTTKRLSPRSRWAALLNIASCVFLGIANTHAHLWGAVAYCVAWILVALGPLYSSL
jgi:hypothetical protein